MAPGDIVKILSPFDQQFRGEYLCAARTADVVTVLIDGIASDFDVGFLEATGKTGGVPEPMAVPETVITKAQIKEAIAGGVEAVASLFGVKD